MPLVALDFETFYSSEYSLKKMSEVEYILDPRFQVIMCSFRVDGGPTYYRVGHAAVAAELQRFDWAECDVLAHNTRFDGAILAWRFGVFPRAYRDTMGMAQATVYPVTGSSSLARVSEYLGLPAKGDEVVRAMGKRLEDFSPDELSAYASYCCRDTDNMWEIYQRLLPAFPESELRQIDLLIRMFVEPQVRLDPIELAEYLHGLESEREAALARVAHLDESTFASNPKFAALLESIGVEVPAKISKTTGMLTYALAKNDRAFKELCEDDSQPAEVQAVLAARLGVKSTLEQKRTAQLLQQALREWPDRTTAWAPVPLRYYGAHTGRPSGGGGGINWLNLKKMPPKYVGPSVRGAVRAPSDDWRILHRDSSQIEARMVAMLARCVRLLNGFARGEDVYSDFASIVFGYPVSKALERERQVGKTSILGLGYGMGAERFVYTLAVGKPRIEMALEEGQSVVQKYRDTYYPIPGLWFRCELMLRVMRSMTAPLRAGEQRRLVEAYTELNRNPIPCITYGPDAVWLPNGMCIAYPRLRVEKMLQDGAQVVSTVYDGPHGTKFLFGGKVVENVSQALARIVVLDVADRVYQETGWRPFLTTYDSLDYCVPRSEAEAMDALLAREFARRPSWAPDLPLASDGGWGRTMLEAEKGLNT